MKLRLKSAIVIYYPLFQKQLKHWALKAFFVVNFLSTFALVWDEDIGRVKLFGAPIGKLGESRVYAFQDAFFDTFIIGWILVLLFYIKPIVLSKVTHSYTISNSLWLKFLPVDSATKAISRVLSVLLPTCLISAICLFWVCLFSVYHSIPVRLLLPSISSLIAYSVLTGGLILLYKGSPNTNFQFRQAIVILVLSLPITLFFFRGILIDVSPYFVPFSAPFTNDVIGPVTTTGINSSFVLGITLMALHVLINTIKKH